MLRSLGEGLRFIPAPAGNIRYFGLRLHSRSVHPRACGEHLGGEDGQIGDGGSSPRLRGTLQRAAKEAHKKRFIPAPAGNIFSEALRDGRTPVHPRACGEHTIATDSK